MGLGMEKQKGSVKRGERRRSLMVNGEALSITSVGMTGGVTR